ncbi:hydroxymethylpyrimidine/phosphomethylpyrimidine kinase [Paenibacillus shirakamiensis]|uniref:Hydroxymethylpyrimidine/phosphomethylpyrimidine kinase n=1 Tax=Paenibacillus shirakamiensis TaxID=1265935 RepID=A0ABS4JFS2_9BACL|nr:hydroxymethylpyrimidine/phosphomethylpyrimidine kinase [Paenibacillus shirakamiensis]
MFYPSALSIAGSDCGGGAGIQADLKTFQELDIYGMSVITAVTAQNTQEVKEVFPLPLQTVEAQLQAIGEDFTPASTKTGMLYSAEIIQLVASAIKCYAWPQIVIDPVMISKSGAVLLQPSAMDTMLDILLPLACLITPNIPEAELISGIEIVDVPSLYEAGQRICSMGVPHVLLKGGHREDSVESTDYLITRDTYLALSSPRIHTRHTHGTGCTLSAAITSGLAKGNSIEKAVSLGKKFIMNAIAYPIEVDSRHLYGPVNHWAYADRGDMR